MKDIEKYLGDILSIEAEIIPLEKPLFHQLPLYITASFTVLETRIFEQRICLLIAKNPEMVYPPDQLLKQTDFVRQKVGFPVVYVSKKVVSYHISRMIRKGVNFIIPGKQLFIPDLLMDLRPTSKTLPHKAVTFTPLAQFLLLYHLQKERINNYTARQLTEKFTQPYRSICRAINNLEELGVTALTGGKEKHLQFTEKGEKLWKQAQRFLLNPVERILFTDNTMEDSQVCLSNHNALAHFTMMNDEKRRYYAISKTGVKDVTVETNKYAGDNRIELWRYNPLPLSNDGFIDKLSLYLLLKKDADERIQSELEEMIKQIQWLEE